MAQAILAARFEVSVYGPGAWSLARTDIYLAILLIFTVFSVVN